MPSGHYGDDDPNRFSKFHHRLSTSDYYKTIDGIWKDRGKIKSQADMRKLIIYQFKKSFYGGLLPEDFDHMYANKHGRNS